MSRTKSSKKGLIHMSTFDMNNATDVAIKMDVYAIYLRKSRADLKQKSLVRVSPGAVKY